MCPTWTRNHFTQSSFDMQKSTSPVSVTAYLPCSTNCPALSSIIEVSPPTRCRVGRQMCVQARPLAGRIAQNKEQPQLKLPYINPHISFVPPPGVISFCPVFFPLFFPLSASRFLLKRYKPKRNHRVSILQ